MGIKLENVVKRSKWSIIWLKKGKWPTFQGDGIGMGVANPLPNPMEKPYVHIYIHLLFSIFSCNSTTHYLKNISKQQRHIWLVQNWVAWVERRTHRVKLAPNASSWCVWPTSTNKPSIFESFHLSVMRLCTCTPNDAKHLFTEQLPGGGHDTQQLYLNLCRCKLWPSKHVNTVLVWLAAITFTRRCQSQVNLGWDFRR